MPSTISQRRERWRRFMLGPDSDRFLFLIRFSPDQFVHPWPMPELVPQRIEWSWSKYCRMVQQSTWLEDDSLPYLDCLTGTEIFAEAFGAQVYRLEGEMPFAHPFVFSVQEAERVQEPTLDAPSLQRMFTIADELHRRAGGDAPVRMVDIQSPMDVAAILWDKTDFYTAIADHPEVVRELAAKIRRLQMRFLDEWFARYGTAHIAHYPDYFMPEGMTLSEDEIGSVSPTTFEDLFLPELNALSDRYGGIGIHCCAHSRHQWAGLDKVRGLRLLNLVQPKAIVAEAFRYFGDRVVHWHSWNGDDEPWTWPDQHPAEARFVIETWAESRDEALRFSDRLQARRLR